LSALKVAQFPWDPQPELPRQPPTVPSNVKADNDLPPVSASQDSLNFPNVPIKAEGGGYQQPPNYPQGQTANGSYNGGGYEPNIAQQRAQSLVQQRLQQNGGMQQQHQNMNFPNVNQQQHHQMSQMPQMPTQGPTTTSAATSAAAATAAAHDGSSAPTSTPISTAAAPTSGTHVQPTNRRC
jgi:transcription initiation factor TFIIA large subunit